MVVPLVLLFQSTHPRGVRHLTTAHTARRSNFNPRTHVGCDLHRHTGGQVGDISIHAPTWGATTRYGESNGWIAFQSTHPRGVRRCRRITQLAYDAISIHAPTWGATKPLQIGAVDVVISIHAPTWGATYRRVRVREHRLISIHAPTWGATHRPHVSQAFRKFQSTHPRGVRPSLRPYALIASQFQSTHPRGVRPSCKWS